MSTILIYGAYGYTGELVARELVRRQQNLVLAGRSAEKLDPVAKSLGCTSRVVGVEDSTALDGAFRGVDAVLNCAGPFSQTALPVARACIRSGTHYLDITGEIGVFERLHALDGQAKEAGVTLLPGVGFDVVPTDCLAAKLHEKMPRAIRLELAIRPSPGVSRGTAATAVEQMGASGLIRSGGDLRREAIGARSRLVDFGKGSEEVFSIPWGDLVTAWVGTGIPEIITYAALPGGLKYLLGPARWLGWLLERRAVASMLQRLVRWRLFGPNQDQRQRWRSHAWGEVRDHDGHTISGRIECPEMYEFTVQSSCAAVLRIIEGGIASGFQTPAKAFGPEFVLSVPGVHWAFDEPS